MRDGEIIETTLGGRIQWSRDEVGLTTAQLARRVGVRTETMHNWECDRAEPRPSKLVTLAGVLGVSAAWLIGGGDVHRPAEGGTMDLMSMRSQLNQAQRLIDSLTATVATLSQQLDAIEQQDSANRG